MFTSLDLCSDHSFGLYLLAVSQSLSPAGQSEDTLAPVSPCCGRGLGRAGLVGEAREQCVDLWHLNVLFILAFSTSVHPLGAGRQVSGRMLPRKNEGEERGLRKAMDSAVE